MAFAIASTDAVTTLVLIKSVRDAFIAHEWRWTFAVNASSTSADGGLTLGFEKGGYQEARGSASGAESYIENAKGLLDSPREW